MADSKKTKTTAKNSKPGNSTKKTPNKISTEDGDEKQVVEIGMYAHVDLLNCWGKWRSQFVAVDKSGDNWVVCEHWHSTNNHNEKFIDTLPPYKGGDSWFIVQS